MVMGYSSAGGGWMWVFGVLTMVAVLVLIGLVVWAVIAVTNRRGPAAAEASPVETGGRTRTRQVLDARYARGEMDSEEYTERLHTLGL